jgi:hypothetical protein
MRRSDLLLERGIGRKAFVRNPTYRALELPRVFSVNLNSECTPVLRSFRRALRIRVRIPKRCT